MPGGRYGDNSWSLRFKTVISIDPGEKIIFLGSGHANTINACSMVKIVSNIIASFENNVLFVLE